MYKIEGRIFLTCSEPDYLVFPAQAGGRFASTYLCLDVSLHVRFARSEDWHVTYNPGHAAYNL